MPATLEAITLENQRLEQRITITAEGSTTFVHGATGWVPMRMLDTRNTTHRLPAMTPRQMETMAFQCERMGWKEIGLAYHDLPDAGIVQR
tara:strand:- start:186 stop:455 length:270 start_codon:yes stop_codon:yes gene_type:complete